MLQGFNGVLAYCRSISPIIWLFLKGIGSPVAEKDDRHIPAFRSIRGVIRIMKKGGEGLFSRVSVFWLNMRMNGIFAASGCNENHRRKVQLASFVFRVGRLWFDKLRFHNSVNMKLRVRVLFGPGLNPGWFHLRSFNSITISAGYRKLRIASSKMWSLIQIKIFLNLRLYLRDSIILASRIRV